MIEELAESCHLEIESGFEANRVIMVENNPSHVNVDGKLVNMNTGEVLCVVPTKGIRKTETRRKIKPSCLRVWLKAWLQWYIEDWRYGPTPIRTRKGKAKL